jgi:hypothetical protein
MPAFTPNRNYPYSIPADPANVPEAIQALAEAVDADLQTLQSLVGPRPMARARGITPVVASGSVTTFNTMPMEVLDFNVGGAVSLPGDGTVQILSEGSWLGIASMSFPPSSGTLSGIRMTIIDGSNTEYADTSTNNFPVVPETQRTMGASGMAFFIPGVFDRTLLRAEVNRTAGGAAFTLRDHTLTLIRMTDGP